MPYGINPDAWCDLSKAEQDEIEAAELKRELDAEREANWDATQKIQCD